jgi:hypothetical protein
MSARHRQAKKLQKYRHLLWLQCTAYLGRNLAIAGALARAYRVGVYHGALGCIDPQLSPHEAPWLATCEFLDSLK